MDFNHSVTFAAANVLKVRIADPSIHNSFRFLGSAVLGGTLRIVLENSYVPDPLSESGAEFQVFGFEPELSVPTGLQPMHSPALPANLVWDLSDLYTTGFVRVVDSSTPFQIWLREHFGPDLDNPDAAPSADPDGDQLTNLLEYAVGLDPRSASPGDRTTVSLTTIGSNQFLTLGFTRALAATDVDYTVQIGNRLNSWSNGSF